jgi:hypothetical protein
VPSDPAVPRLLAGILPLEEVPPLVVMEEPGTHVAGSSVAASARSVKTLKAGAGEGESGCARAEGDASLCAPDATLGEAARLPYPHNLVWSGSVRFGVGR